MFQFFNLEERTGRKKKYPESTKKKQQQQQIVIYHIFLVVKVCFVPTLPGSRVKVRGVTPPCGNSCCSVVFNDFTKTVTVLFFY